MPEQIIFALFTFIIGLIAIIFSTVAQVYSKRTEDRSNRRISLAESKADREPEKIKPAWDLARVTLEAYFNRNLSQVTAIFWLCMSVMLIGFVIIASGVVLAIQTPEKTLPTIITGLAGVVTELIGATFLFVYRSIMQQAINYTRTLERINSVGMAMQILDTIPDDVQIENLKSSIKATVVRMLMQQAFEVEKDSNESFSNPTNEEKK